MNRPELVENASVQRDTPSSLTEAAAEALTLQLLSEHAHPNIKAQFKERIWRFMLDRDRMVRAEERERIAALLEHHGEDFLAVFIRQSEERTHE